MTQLTDKIYAVEVPEDATNIEICNYGLNDALEWMHHIAGVAAYCVDDLPPGTYHFLFTTKTATEEDARKVVGGSLLTASIRLATLMYHKGCMAENYALIEKTK